MLKGLDVSHQQGGGILWKQVKAGGHEFVFLKATEGATFVDAHYAHNRAQALATGLLVGSYHFYRYGTDWGAQAHNFCSVVAKLQPGELPPVIDLEDQDFRDGKIGLSVADATRKTLAFIETVSDHLGKRPIIYADRDFIKHFLQDESFAKSSLWVAAYRRTPPIAPPPWKSFDFWQYDAHGTVPGIYGEVDLDYFLGDEAALQNMAVK